MQQNCLCHEVSPETCGRNEHLRYRRLAKAESCYFIILSDKVSYLLYSIILLSQIIATTISTVKFERNNPSFTIGYILNGEFNWNMYEITPPCHVINICILHRLYHKQPDCVKDELIGYTHANFHHPMTFSCRNIALQIWWLPCEPQRSEWPKTFLGQCIPDTKISMFNQCRSDGLCYLGIYVSKVHWFRDCCLLFKPMLTYCSYYGSFSELWIKIQEYSFQKMHLKTPSANDGHFVPASRHWE